MYVSYICSSKLQNMKFEEYHISPEIKQNLAEQGFKRPTDIQYKAIFPILKGEDVLAIAQTGTGKTAAFAIPLIHLLQQKRESKYYKESVKCVVMAPTHELAIQITQVFNKLCKGTGVQAFGVYGGVDQDPQIDKLAVGVDILIATPGRMFDLVSQGHLTLKYVEYLVLDEADHMLDMGFIKDIRELITMIPKKRQTLFFSATINETIKKLAYSIVNNAIRIQISPKDPVSKNITHSVIAVEMDDKRFFLERIIQQNPESKILVFVRTRVRAERVASAMQRVHIETLTIHGDKDQAMRKQALEQFRNNECKILIATDVTARGIDIPNVDYVINYDLPDVPENYVHRIGRTGRGVNKGTALSFCSPEERVLLTEIEEYTNTKIEEHKIDWRTYKETLDFTADTGTNNWKQLIKQAAYEEKAIKSRKRKK